MSYETDLKEIYARFAKFSKNNPTISSSDFRSFLKYAYVTGRSKNEKV